MARYLLIPVLALLALVACTPLTSVKVSPSYFLGHRPAQLSCGVVIPHAVSIDYEGNVEDEFGKGDPKVGIERFVKGQLLNDIRKYTHFDTAWHVSLQGGWEYREDTVAVRGTHDVICKVPLEGELLLVTGSQPKFLLILERVRVVSKQELTIRPGGQYGHSYFGSEKDLVVSGRFVLWDNTKGALVSNGYAVFVEENSFSVSLEDWYLAMAGFVKELFSETVLAR